MFVDSSSHFCITYGSNTNLNFRYQHTVCIVLCALDQTLVSVYVSEWCQVCRKRWYTRGTAVNNCINLTYKGARFLCPTRYNDDSRCLLRIQ